MRTGSTTAAPLTPFTLETKRKYCKESRLFAFDRRGNRSRRPLHRSLAGAVLETKALAPDFSVPESSGIVSLLICLFRTHSNAIVSRLTTDRLCGFEGCKDYSVFMRRHSFDAVLYPLPDRPKTMHGKMTNIAKNTN